MKWSKFRSVIERYPWLLQLIDVNQLLVNPETYSYDEKRLGPIREFVRHKLEYIAFRPFDALRLEMETERGYYQIANSSEHAFRCDPYFGGDKDAWYDEEWQIMTHNGAGTISGWALQDEASLLDTIAMIEQRNIQGFMGPGDLSFDFILKMATEGKRTPKGRILTKMTVDVYPFPLWYHGPQAMKQRIQKDSKPLVSHSRSYVGHENPPPLIPGTLQFAGE